MKVRLYFWGKKSAEFIRTKENFFFKDECDL